jgi:hypothetical protein
MLETLETTDWHDDSARRSPMGSDPAAVRIASPCPNTRCPFAKSIFRSIQPLDVGAVCAVSQFLFLALLALRSRAVTANRPAFRVQALSRRLPTETSVALRGAGWHSRGGVFGSSDVGPVKPHGVGQIVSFLRF